MNQSDRRPGTDALRGQEVHVSLEVLHPHEDDERASRGGKRSQRWPIRPPAGFVRIFVPRHHRESGVMIPMGHRDAGVGGGGDRARHARDHFIRDARSPKRLRLLATAPEDERVASLETHYVVACQRLVHQQLFDVCLAVRGAGVRATLAHVDPPRRGRGQLQQRRLHEVVIDHDLGAAQDLDRANRHQTGVAGPGAHEPDLPGHRWARRAMSSRPPRSSSSLPSARPRASSSVRSPSTSPSRISLASGIPSRAMRWIRLPRTVE